MFHCVKIFLLILVICCCNSEEDGGSTNLKPIRPRYTEIRRSQRVTSTTTEKLDLSEEEKDGVDTSEGVQEEKDQVDSIEEVHETQSNARQPPTPNAKTKEYVEYIRPGATPRPKITTTRPRKKVVDPTARPEGCGQCRFYCKQCKGSEEVASGGVWGCCNHNCCGGRCSCQKVQ